MSSFYQKNRNAIYSLVLISVGIIVVYLVLKNVNVHEVAANVKKIPASMQLCIFLLFVASRFFQAARMYLLYPNGISPTSHFGISLAGQLMNLLVPLRGGDVARFLLLMKSGVQKARGALAGYLVMDKLFEALSMVPMVLIVFFAAGANFFEIHHISNQYLNEQTLKYYFAATIVLFSALLFFWLRSPKARQYLTFKSTLRTFGAGVLHWAFFALAFCYLVGDVKTGLLLATIVNFASAVPISPGSIGVFEAAYMWGATQFIPEQSIEVSLAQAVVLHTYQILVPALGGGFFLLKYGLPKGDASKVPPLDPLA